MNRRTGFERKRLDGLRYPRRAILYVRIYWLTQRRAYAAGGSVLECGHADTVHQKGEPTRDMARTHMRCKFCDPIAALVVAGAALLMLLTGCSGAAFTAGELGAGDVGGSSSSSAGAAELAHAGAAAAGAAGLAELGGSSASSAGAPDASEGGSSGEAGSSSSAGSAGAAPLCGCKNGTILGQAFCPAAPEGCYAIVCAGDVNHCFQLCDGVCK